MNYRVFPCPGCGEIIDTAMQTCRFCGVAVDADAAGAAAARQERVQKACAQASSARISALAMPGFFLLSFAPFLGIVGLAGTAATLVIVPCNVIQWRSRFGRLESPDPDLARARRAVRVALLVWAAMVIVNVLWFLFRFSLVGYKLMIAALVLVALSLWLAIRQARGPLQAEADPRPGPTPKSPVKMGKALRMMMLSELQAPTPTKEFPRVYGVLMDWPISKTTATVVSLHDGSASLYTTSDFGVIGGIGHESVRTAAIRFVRAADRYYEEAVPTSDVSYPPSGRVRFYLLTFQGVRAFDTDLASLESGAGRYAEIFELGQTVLTELRLRSEKDR